MHGINVSLLNGVVVKTEYYSYDRLVKKDNIAANNVNKFILPNYLHIKMINFSSFFIIVDELNNIVDKY